MIVSFFIPLVLAATALAAPAPADAVAIPRATAEPIHIPITAHDGGRYHPDPEVRRAWMHCHELHVRCKYARFYDDEYRQEIKRELAQLEEEGAEYNKRANVPYDALYFIPLSIGTPPQQLRFQLDTGSTDLIVRAKCKDPAYTAQKCATAPMFKSGVSSTFHSDNSRFGVTYGKGGANGTKGADVVTIADYSVNLTFGFADQTEYITDDGSSGLSGVAGFAWSKLSQWNTGSLWEKVLAANSDLEPMFGIYTNRVDGPLPVKDLQMGKIKDASAVLTLGGTDKSKYSGEITWLDAPSKGFWTVNLSSVSINTQPIDVGFMNNAVIDSGTSLLFGPPSLVRQLYKYVPGAQEVPGNPGNFVFPCHVVNKTDFDFSFNFGSLRVRVGKGLAALVLGRPNFLNSTETYC